jgi:hypothetical protein
MLRITAGLPGQNGVTPRRVQIVTTDSLSQVTTAGYLTEGKLLPYTIFPTDIIDMIYSLNEATGVGTYGQFLPTITAGVITLTQYLSPGDVTLPVISGHIAVFDGTTGKVGDDAATAINGGNIQAGLSGTAGFLASFPATASKGSFRVVATANSGDTVTTLTNAAMGQATVVTIPDPAAATATIPLKAGPFVGGNLVKCSGTAGLLVDGGFSLLGSTTATWAGGGTSHTFVALEVSATSTVVATILASTNDVSITKVVPGAGDIAVTFSADPGADTTLNYITLLPTP